MLAKVIMTELERNCGNQMMESVKLKFYMRCINDILLVGKQDDIHYIFGKFNSSQKFEIAVDCFDNSNLYFLVLRHSHR